METAELIEQVNQPVGERRWVRYALWSAGLLVVFFLGVFAQATVAGWWNQRKVDRQNIDAMVQIIQYNIQGGKLAIPPQLAPPPQAAPGPPPPAASAAPAKPPADPPAKAEKK